MAKRRPLSRTAQEAQEAVRASKSRKQRPHQLVMDREQKALLKSAKLKMRYGKKLTRAERSAVKRFQKLQAASTSGAPRKFKPHIPRGAQSRGTAALRRQIQAVKDAKEFQEFSRAGEIEEANLLRKKAIRSARGGTMGPVAAAGRKTGPAIEGPISKYLKGMPPKGGLMNTLKRAVYKRGGLKSAALKSVASGAAMKGLGAAAIGNLIYQLVSYGIEQHKASEELDMLKSTPQTTAQDYLRSMRKQQLLMARQGRLMRSDPEAYKALRDYVGDVDGQTPLATGEFVVGGAPRGQPASNEEVRALLANL